MNVGARRRAEIFGPLVRYPNGNLGAPRDKLVTVTTPWGVAVVAHRLVAAVFLQACRDAYRTAAWKPQRIDSFNPRPVRGSDAVSLHAFGIAWDFFATKPGVVPPGGVWTPVNPVPPYFAECFTRRGFRWGATFDRVDLPHIEWPGGLPGQTATEATPAPHTEEDDMTPEQKLVLADGWVRDSYRLRPDLKVTEDDINYWTHQIANGATTYGAVREAIRKT